MNTIRNILNNRNPEYVALLLLILMVLYSYCSLKPAVITQTECNDAAITQYIQECIPKNTVGKEWQYYYDECMKQAKSKYCNETRYIIVKVEHIPCNEVPEKYRELCK